jgi:hypothetical protein
MNKLTAMIFVLSLGAILALQGSARALPPCPAGCGQQKMSCVQTARVAKLTCKKDCRENADPTGRGACMIGCSSTFRSAKTSCQADHVSCLDSCNPPPPPGPPSPPNSCLGDCGKDLAACARDVTAQARTCVGVCRTEPDRLTCLKDCIAAAQQGGATCASDFRACRDACAGSPSGAFIE